MSVQERTGEPLKITATEQFALEALERRRADFVEAQRNVLAEIELRLGLAKGALGETHIINGSGEIEDKPVVTTRTPSV